MADVRDLSWSFKAYTIPRKERRPSEDCQYVLPVNSREAKEIEQSIKRLTWDTNDLVDRAFSISYIKKVDNLALEREYHEKRASMREKGRLPKELSQQLAFCVQTEDCRVRDICRIGLVCDGVDHTLGDGYMGVTVWRCPDLCLRALSWPTSGTAYLMVFKIVKGRVKFVSAKLSPKGDKLEPSPNYDCHVSRNTACSSVTDLTTLMRSTQYYLYEYDDEGLPSKRPRHCLPFAVIALQRSEEMAILLKSPVCLENVACAVKDSTLPVEDLTPFFNVEDGILAWRGLVTCKDKRLGCVSLLAGHKLGINFWKSYLDVSTKILLKQLGALLPGDVKSAWRSPLDYRNYVLSLCTMRVASRQQSETFTSFTRHLAIKAKAAGVLCIDPSTTMFLVPSGKLAVRLGFCAVAEPLRMFCIVCRRQSSFAPSVCPLTPPTVSRSAPSSPSTPVWPAVSILRPASLDFNVRHKSKIVVSSPSNSSRHSHPRHIVKRSLSFSHSPVRNDSKSLQRTSRSASSSGTVAFQGDITIDSKMSSDFSNDNVMSTTEEESLKNQSRMLDAVSKENETNSAKSLKGRSCNSLDLEHLESNPEFSTVSSASFNTAKSSKPKLAVLNLSRLKTLRRLRNVSTNVQNGNSESIIQSNGSTNKSSITPWNAEYLLQNDSFTREGQDRSKTETGKYQDLCPSDLLADSEYERSHTPTTSTNFSQVPFWPDSPLVLFPDRERIPFLSDTPVKTIQAEDTKEAISESPREDLPHRHSENIASENLELNPDSPLKSPKLSVVQCKQRQDSLTDTLNYHEHSDLGVVQERGSECASMTLSRSSSPNWTGKGNEAPNNDVGMVVLEGNSCSRGKCDVQPFKMDEKIDSKPSAFRCMVKEKVVDFHDDTGAQLGGVIETSLVYDWGLQRASKGRSSNFKKESYSSHVEENGCVEVCEVDSELDKPHDPIDIWSVIDTEFAEPVTVICSPPSSVETFTMRFPGNVASEDDVAEEFTKEIRTTEEETLLLEKRLQGVFREALVVNCPRYDSEIVGSPGARCPNKEASSKGSLALSGSGSVEAFKQVVSVASVSETADEELQTSQLREFFGSFLEGSELFLDLCPEQLRFTETDTILGRSNKCSEPAAPQSMKLSNEEIAIQSKKSGVSNNQASPRQINNESLETSLKGVNCPFKDLHTKSCCLIKAVDNSTSQTAGGRWKEVKVKFATETQPSRKRRQEAQGGREMKTKNRQGKFVCIAQWKGKEEVETEYCQGKSTCSARSQGDDPPHRNDLTSQGTVNCISNPHCFREFEGQRKEKQTDDSMERLPPKQAQNSGIHATNADETVDLIHAGNACVTLVHKARIEAKNTAEEGKKKSVTFASTPTKKRRDKDLIKEKREQRSSLNCSSGHLYVKKERLPVYLEDEVQSTKNELPKAKVVIGQKPVTPKRMQQEASPKNPVANDLKNSPFSDDKQLTSTLDTVKTCGFNSPKTGRNGSQTVRSGEKSASDPVGTRDIGLKSAERNAFTARHLKQHEIAKPTELLNSTLSHLNFSKKLEINVQLDTNKDCCSDKRRNKDPHRRIESLGDINDAEKDIHADNRTISGKKKNVPELEKASKQGKSSPTPPLSYTGGCQDLESKAPDKVFVPIFSEDNRLIGHYTERSHHDHNRALDKDDALTNHADHAYPDPRRVPLIQPVYSSFQNRRIKAVPQFMPDASNQYPQRGFTNLTRFQFVYPRFPNYSRPVFVRGMYQAHPLLPPALTLPGPWSSPGNVYQVRNTPTRPR